MTESQMINHHHTTINPYIIDEENYGKRPKPFDNNDPSTYPSDRDQRQKLSTWEFNPGDIQRR